MSIVIEVVGLTCGLSGSVLLFLSTKVGAIMDDGRIRFDGTDDLSDVDERIRKVKASHLRNKFFVPAGWSLISLAFLLQLIGLLI